MPKQSDREISDFLRMKFNFSPPGGAPYCLNAPVKEGMTARGAKSTQGLALERGQRGSFKKQIEKGLSKHAIFNSKKHPSAKNWSTKAKFYTREHDFQRFQDSRPFAVDERHACARECDSPDNPSNIYSARSRRRGSPLSGQISNLLYYSQIASKTASELSSKFTRRPHTHRLDHQARKKHYWIRCTPDPRRFIYLQPVCGICRLILYVKINQNLWIKKM